jgi:hypothetical protein
MSLAKPILVLLLAVFVSACGGGGGSDSQPDDTNNTVGVGTGTDTDNDGVEDSEDDFPLDPNRSDATPPVIDEMVSASGLKHPGVLQSAAELNALAEALAEQDPYRMQLWASMMGSARGRIDKTDWISPLDLVGTNFHSSAKYAGAGLIRYVNDWVINGTPSSEASAITILNKWAEIRSFTPEGNSHKLVGGIFFGYIAHAAELLLSTDTNWPVEEQYAFKQMVRDILLPMVNEDRMVSFNGNLDLRADAELRQAQHADVSLAVNSNYNGRSYLRINAGGDHYVAQDGKAFTRSGWCTSV